MPPLLKFHYDAITKDGKTIDGMELAESTEEVILKLLQKGLYPSRIETINPITGIAYERLDKLKKLRDKIQPKSQLPLIRATPKIAIKKTNLLLVILILLWMGLIIAYLLL